MPPYKHRMSLKDILLALLGMVVFAGLILGLSILTTSPIVKGVDTLMRGVAVRVVLLIIVVIGIARGIDWCRNKYQDRKYYRARKDHDI